MVVTPNTVARRIRAHARDPRLRWVQAQYVLTEHALQVEGVAFEPASARVATEAQGIPIEVKALRQL